MKKKTPTRPNLNTTRGAPRTRCPVWGDDKNGRYVRCAFTPTHKGRCSFERYKRICANGNPKCTKSKKHEVCSNGLKMKWRNQAVSKQEKKGAKFWRLVEKLIAEKKNAAQAA